MFISYTLEIFRHHKHLQQNHMTEVTNHLSMP